MDVHTLILGGILALGVVIGAAGQAAFTRSRSAPERSENQRLRRHVVLLQGATIAYEEQASRADQRARIWRQAFIRLLGVVDPDAAARAMRDIAQAEAGALLHRARAVATAGGTTEGR